MVQRRAKAARIKTRIGCHTFRATGITIYLTNGGDLEKAQQMAAHESPRTTKLYGGAWESLQDCTLSVRWRGHRERGERPRSRFRRFMPR